MKLKILIIVCIGLFYSPILHAQTVIDKEKEVIDVKYKIDNLRLNLKVCQENYNFYSKKIDSLKFLINGQMSKDLVEVLSTYHDKATEYKSCVQNSQNEWLKLKQEYVEKGIDEKTMDAFFENSEVSISASGGSTNVDVEERYLYFGENKIVNKKLFNNKSTEALLLNDLLNDIGKEVYLGDISVPKEGQRFLFYENFSEDKCCRVSSERSDQKVKNDFLKGKPSNICKRKFYMLTQKPFSFKKLSVEIKDGYFHDILVEVKDDNGDVHVFTNSVGLSVLFYSQYNSNIHLYYLYSKRNGAISSTSNYSDEKMSQLYIKLTDVMGYTFNIGKRYIPLDLDIQLPKDDVEGKVTNKDNRAVYEIRQNTYLDKVVELRAYTDFLALFDKAPNGVLQLEGRAKFFLFPYPFSFLGTRRTLGQIEYFPSLSPYVNFSKIRTEDDVEEASVVEGVGTEGDLLLVNVDESQLALVQQRFLTMGLNLDVLKWRNKNSPVVITVYGLVDYNLVSIVNPLVSQGEELKKEVVKSLNLGAGLQLEVNRFNNFGMKYRFEYSSFNFKDFNGGALEGYLPSAVPITKHDVEVYYHPGQSPNRSIFVRLQTYNYAGANREAFYQFQFGYKFTIGNRTSNGRNIF